MLTYHDITGQQFGKWTVLRYSRNAPTRFICRCECGTESEVRAGNLMNGSSPCCRRCGIDQQAATMRTHGHSRTLIYGIWTQMKKRCTNPRDKSYAGYGAKGIHVCARWLNSFAAFLADMGERPSNRHSIERVDGTKGYEPGNCVWATASEQTRNMSTNIFVVIDGNRMILKDACRIKQLPYDAVRCRLYRGWSMERALSTPLRVSIDGRYTKELTAEVMTIAQETANDNAD